MAESRYHARTMRVSCLQIDPQASDPDGNLRQVEQALRAAAAEGDQLCLLPEMWPTSFRRDVDDTAIEQTQTALQCLAQWTRELDLMVGGSAYGSRAEGPPSNRFHLFDRGEEIAFYEKGHLFSPTAEHLSFSAGDLPPQRVSTRLGPMHPVICYDLRFPEWVRHAARDGSQVMLVCAQWPHPRTQHWRALAIGRAVESQCFVVACNRRGEELIGRRQKRLSFPGNSIIVGPGGEVLAEGTPEREAIRAELDFEGLHELRRILPVWKDERREGLR